MKEMIGIIERLRIKARHRPHEPIWLDAINAIEALRAQAERDEALLRQALDALDSDRSDIQLRTAIALRERLREQE